MSICANHQSYSDVVYLSSLGIPFKWIVKRELFWIPGFGVAMRVAKYPKIHRGDITSTRRLMGRVAELLAAGIPILSFPEGSRSPTGEMQAFQPGPARMAIENGVPILPVGVAGTARLLPKGSPLYARDGAAAIHIGAPISTAGLTKADARALTERVRRAVGDAKVLAQQSVDATWKPRGRRGPDPAEGTPARPPPPRIDRFFAPLAPPRRLTQRRHVS